MNDLKHVQESSDAVLAWMSEKEYSVYTIKNHSGVLNVFMKFMTKQQISELNETTALLFIQAKTGVTMEGLWGPGNRKLNRYLKPIQNLLRHYETGQLGFYMRSKVPPFLCPEAFKKEYLLFQDEYHIRGYADATILSNNTTVRRFIIYLSENTVHSSKEITVSLVTRFLKAYSSLKPKYIATILYVLRNYLNFLHEKGFMTCNISDNLPSVRLMRNAFIPHSWKKEDVLRLLDAIDREDAKGKRDYAIILIVVRLGLRASDIRKMKITDINWHRRTINLTMQKTGYPVELPLLDDIGWAVIDYLKNGRPDTKCSRLFVRHRAPFDAVGENESFYRELHRYMQAAGITPPQGDHCGLHSLRSTLARQMLDSNAPLPVISETLGHQNINTTSIYLKIDIEGLRRCALDPEEVFKC
jgi:integrase/recombinase XerD